jgi:hypothetical protein
MWRVEEPATARSAIADLEDLRAQSHAGDCGNRSLCGANDCVSNFLVLELDRCQLLWFAVTRNPTAEWLARQTTETFPWDSDQNISFATMTKYLAPRSGLASWRWESETNPRRSDRLQNGYVERVIGFIRRECTDHLLVFNAEHVSSRQFRGNKRDFRMQLFGAGGGYLAQSRILLLWRPTAHWPSFATHSIVEVARVEVGQDSQGSRTRRKPSHPPRRRSTTTITRQAGGHLTGQVFQPAVRCHHDTFGRYTETQPRQRTDARLARQLFQHRAVELGLRGLDRDLGRTCMIAA